MSPSTTSSDCPFDPAVFDRVLSIRPDLGTALLASLPFQEFVKQAHAQSAIQAQRRRGCDSDEEFTAELHQLFDNTPAILLRWDAEISAEYVELIGSGAVYDPEELTLMNITEARLLLTKLTPTQRVQQAVVYVGWLSELGYRGRLDDVLIWWAIDGESIKSAA